MATARKTNPPRKEHTTMANKIGFAPKPTEAPKGAGGPGRSYTQDQLDFFATCAQLDRDAWYEWEAPNVAAFTKLLRSAANWLSTSEDGPKLPTGVKIRPIGDLDASYEGKGTVKFSFGAKGKPRGRGAAAVKAAA